MSTIDIGRRLVAYCRGGRNRESIDTLYAQDAVSIEAGGPPGGDPQSTGLDAIRAKSDWWLDNHEIHSAEITGPWPLADRFIVRFSYDVTNKPSGRRMQMDEAALYTVRDDRIVREEFFYSMGG